MNKAIILAIAAGGALLMNSPNAAAHNEVRNVHLSPSVQRVELYRSQHMPHWLKRDRPFVRWYKRTSLKRDRLFTWRELYRIYRWDRAGMRRYQRDVRHHHNYRGYRPHAEARLSTRTKRKHRH